MEHDAVEVVRAIVEEGIEVRHVRVGRIAEPRPGGAEPVVDRGVPDMYFPGMKAVWLGLGNGTEVKCGIWTDTLEYDYTVQHMECFESTVRPIGGTPAPTP